MGSVFGSQKEEPQKPTYKVKNVSGDQVVSTSNPKEIKERILFQILSKDTTPFEGQKPGTSGLRKKVKVFQQPNYLENFIQSIFDTQSLNGGTIVLGGDGRFFSDKAGEIIVRIAAANGLKKVCVGANWLLGTPAAACEITTRKASGGIILTASHNPGGPEGDFGVKYNGKNGGPAASSVTDAIFQRTKEITSYKTADLDLANVDFSKPGFYVFGDFELEIFDPVSNYLKLLKSIFDFEAIGKLIARNDFSMVFDALSGVGGEYAKTILGEELKVPADCLFNCTPLPDFNGGHPDPNLTYAKDLVKKMGLGANADEDEKIPTFGAACDGDMDRNMVMGSKFFICPCDSLAVIAANSKAIPYFQKNPLKGVARSMPTSKAVVRVAEKLGFASYEVPTGWKFFGNLIGADKISLCGEESFGTGSEHVLEKDGIWAVLAWLSILADANKATEEGKLVGVKDILEAHWKTYGRNYYNRYDFETVDKDAALKMMELLRAKFKEELVLDVGGEDQKVVESDEFEYRDPVDGSVAKGQGIRFTLEDGSRIIFRLSGTGSSGATIRLYMERFLSDDIMLDNNVAMAPLVEAAMKLSQITELTGRKGPDVIT